MLEAFLTTAAFIEGAECFLHLATCQVALLRGSQLHGSGTDILAAAQKSIAELQPVIAKGEADSFVQQVGSLFMLISASHIQVAP